jgi:two-component system, NarL family, sensor kinase
LLKNSGVYTIDFNVNGSSFNLPAEKQIVIYRIVQEALNNIIKHAQATSINIYLNYNFPVLQLIITDNGIGYSLDIKNTGLGLNSMKNRANLINATLHIKSTINKGTEIILNVE